MEVSAISELEQFSQVCEDNLLIASDLEFSENLKKGFGNKETFAEEICRSN